MADDIKPSTDTSKEVGKKKGKESGFGKYKWWIIAGAVIVILLVVWYMRQNSASASGSSTSPTSPATDNIDPATGFPNGSPADLAALGSSGTLLPTPGPAGPTGPAGPQGPKGPAGPTGKAGGSATSPHPCPQGMRYDFARKQCVPFGTFGPTGKKKQPKPKGGPRSGR